MLALSLEGFRSPDCLYPTPRPACPVLPSSALSVNGACPDPVGVLGTAPSPKSIRQRLFYLIAILHTPLSPLESHLLHTPAN
jgi:hypothetical protein